MEVLFWSSIAGAAFAYLGYPVLLLLLGVFKRPVSADAFGSPAAPWPSLSLMIPAHNEAAIIAAKIDNALGLAYSGDLQILVISDGSTDETGAIVRRRLDDPRLHLMEINDRRGKANALNRGLELATGEIIVFTDASIMLDNEALVELVAPFADPEVGCVSGEDKIAGSSGEGVYGRYELFLRRQEAALGSLVGASGSIYAQKRILVVPFPEGLAPDFLSVLNTVRRGYRAIAAPRAIGWMTAVKEASDEFQRKARTAVRGMAALFANPDLLNPLRYPLFSVFLWSHKIMRWAVPFFLLGLFVSSGLLAGQAFYALVFALQVACYGLVLYSLSNRGRGLDLPFLGIAQFFVVSNAAMLVAWVRYWSGFRQEIWGPSKRNAAD